MGIFGFFVICWVGLCYRGECLSHNLKCNEAGYDTPCKNPFPGQNFGKFVQAHYDPECGSVWCMMGDQCGLVTATGQNGVPNGVPCSGVWHQQRPVVLQ